MKKTSLIIGVAFLFAGSTVFGQDTSTVSGIGRLKTGKDDKRVLKSNSVSTDKKNSVNLNPSVNPNQATIDPNLPKDNLNSNTNKITNPNTTTGTLNSNPNNGAVNPNNTGALNSTTPNTGTQAPVSNSNTNQPGTTNENLNTVNPNTSSSTPQTGVGK